MTDGSSRLSDGVVIETSVLARLLGVKLLTLEGTVLVSPAQLRAGYEALATTAVAPAAEIRREVPAEGLNGGSTARRGAASGEALGARLGTAARLLAESADDLRGIETGP